MLYHLSKFVHISTLKKTLSDILFYLVIVFYTQITFNHNLLTLQSEKNITEVVYETGP